MAIDIFQTLNVIETMENFIEKERPPENIRHELDLSYKIEEQSVIVFEIRPNWRNKKEKMESMVAKATFVKSNNKWKIFWQRADLKWHLYAPMPLVPTLSHFVKIIKEDSHGCFWG